MAIHPAGKPIALGADISNEFGIPSPPGISLGKYRVSETYGAMTNIPLDEGIPQPGAPIAFSDFYGKQLNMVVNFFGGGKENRQNMKDRFLRRNAGDVYAVGGFINPPPINTAGKRVIIHVNKLISSNQQNKHIRNSVSLKTGNWDEETNLDLNVGPRGYIVGAGGDGGYNGHRGAGPTVGKVGTSALGVSYPLGIYNYGTIAGGGGGGKGATSDSSTSRRYYRCGWWCERRDQRQRRAPGGGGGGGAGFPNGAGGAARKGGSNGSDGVYVLNENSQTVPPSFSGGPGGAGAGRGRGSGTSSSGYSGGNPGSPGGGSANSNGHGIIISGTGNVNDAPVPGIILGGQVNGQFT
jgi:hypothetical protein